MRSRDRRGPRVWAGVALLAVLAGLGDWARAELGVDVSVEEGVSVLGGPLDYRLARSQTDAVTGASVDAITAASHVSHGGGVHVQLSRGGGGSVDLGLEYAQYRFDLDTGFGRADVGVTALRIPFMVRLALWRFRGNPALTFGFGGYLELVIADRAALSGDPIGLELEPASVGLAVSFHLHPWRFELPGGRGALVPGAFLRGYRGLKTQLRDDLGSAAPLCSIALGLELRYALP